MKYCNKCGDPVSENEKFCNKCGNPLAENNINNNTNNSNFNKTLITHKTLTQDQQNIIIGLFAGLAILSSIFMCSYAYKTLSNSIFISDTPRETPTVTEDKTTNNDIPKKGKYQTVIVADNIYSGVSITNKDDGYKLIVSDSVNQKSNCPKEILSIENEFINKYGITAVNLCELNVSFAKEIMGIFDKLYTDFPQLKKYLTNLTLTNDPGNDGYIAAFQSYFGFADDKSGYPIIAKTQMLLNSKYFLNESRLESSMRAGSNSGHFPPNTTRSSSISHELGHYVSFLAMMSSHSLDSVYYSDSDAKQSKIYEVLLDFSKGNYSLDIITTAYNNYKNDSNDNIELDAWRGTISQYALAKNNNGEYIYDETIAESFHDVFVNGNNAKPASKYIYKEVKERFERLVK